MSGPRGGETSWAMEAAGAFLRGFSFFLHHCLRWDLAGSGWIELMLGSGFRV